MGIVCAGVGVPEHGCAGWGLGSSCAGAESGHSPPSGSWDRLWGGGTHQGSALGRRGAALSWPRSPPARLCRRPPVLVDAGTGGDMLPCKGISNLERKRILGAFAELDNNVPSELHPKHATKLKEFFSPLI